MMLVKFRTYNTPTFSILANLLTAVLYCYATNTVSLVADTKACNISVRCIGGNSSGINNKKLKKNETHILQHGDQLELLLGKYIYKVGFVPPPESGNRPVASTKTKYLTVSSNHKNNDEKSFDKSDIPLKRPKISDSEGNTEMLTSKSMWEDFDGGKLLIYTKEGTQSSSHKIAGYDLDGTLILTKSGKVFPQHRDDWNIANSNVKPVLSKFFENGYKVIVFTNQAGISRGKTSVVDFKYKTEKIVEALGIPIQVFVATADDIYRKPAPGMWDFLIKKKNSGLAVDLNESFFVGDAAGREQNWMPKKKKDFSSADRLFALNIGLKFHTPEAHFLNQPEGKYKLPEFIPSSLDHNLPISDSNLISDTKEVVVMVGSPGSGKSFFVKTYMVPAGYVHVNRDTLGSWQRCISDMEHALSSGKSVVIDNTNPDKMSRKRYLDIAMNKKIPCRCFVLNTTIQHAMHNNKFRRLTHEDHVPVNDIIINSYKKKFESPTKDEGFSEIVKVNFCPKFSDPEKESLYKMFIV
ncbi:polynucleotide kinase 3'-phosphatase isoform X2 [Lycorma delicatula]|uniref:polynucleotide kinase 3'-phosphatase isoform X2 n=1 Tax=Lycorma delicatula TaxID=130591 RepID=UPI003F516134